MKKVLLFLVIGGLYSCSKSVDIQHVIQQPTSSTITNSVPNTVSPTVYNYKDYKSSSFETQSSPTNVDVLNILVNSKNSLGSDPMEIIRKGISISATSFLDINGDGLDDIFVNPVTSLSFQGREKVSSQIYINNNGKYIYDESYIDQDQLPRMNIARKSIVGDFNNDKRPDIFLAGFGMDAQPYPGESNVLLLSDSNKKYKKTEFSNNIGVFHSACSGDIDNDGDLDIFALANDKSYILINDGKGNFTVSTKELNLSSLSSLFTSELFDINKDGYVDLILGGHEFNVKDTSFTTDQGYEGATRIYWGSALGTYNENKVTYLPVNPYFGVVLDIDFADLDGDGISEICLNRTGGRLVNNNLTDFYKGWTIQILKFDANRWVDKSGSFIEDAMDLNAKEVVWMKFYNLDNKLYYESMNITGTPTIKWGLGK